MSASGGPGSSVAIDASSPMEWSSHPRFRAFQEEVSSVLSQFDRVREWADLSRSLQRLQRAFEKYPNVPGIPERLTISKRLAQCLNPALPGGVHVKVIETYSIILDRLEERELAVDLPLFTIGIYPYFQRASVQLRPIVLELIEKKLVLRLRDSLIPGLSGLVLALLPGMEEPGTEGFDATQRVLSLIADLTSVSEFYRAICEGVLLCPQYRMGAFHLLTDRINHGKLQEVRSYIQSSRGVVLNALSAALRDPVLLVQRGALDFISAAIPFDSPDFDDAYKLSLIRAALLALASREVPVMRRFFSWLYGGQDFNIDFFRHHSMHLLVQGVKLMFLEIQQSSDMSDLPFRVCANIVSRHELAEFRSIFREFIIPALRAIQATSAVITDLHDSFLGKIGYRTVWSELCTLLDAASSSDRTEIVEPLQLITDCVDALPRNDALTLDYFPVLLNFVSHLSLRLSASAEYLSLFAAFQLAIKLVNRLQMTLDFVSSSLEDSSKGSGQNCSLLRMDSSPSSPISDGHQKGIWHAVVGIRLSFSHFIQACISDGLSRIEVAELFRNLCALLSTSEEILVCMCDPSVQLMYTADDLKSSDDLMSTSQDNFSHELSNLLSLSYAQNREQLRLLSSESSILHLDALIHTLEISPDVFIIETAAETFLSLYSTIVDDTFRKNALYMSAKKIWMLFSDDSILDHHPTLTHLFIRSYQLDRSTTSHIILDDLARVEAFSLIQQTLSNKIPRRLMDISAYIRFVRFWKTIDEVKLPFEDAEESSSRSLQRNAHMPPGLVYLLDTLSDSYRSHYPQLSLIGSVWIRDSLLSNASRILDPLFRLCLDDEFALYGHFPIPAQSSSTSGVESKQSRLSGSLNSLFARSAIYSRLIDPISGTDSLRFQDAPICPFDEGRAMYVLSTWNAILGICPSEFMNALLSFRVSPSLLALSMTHVVAAPGVPSIRDEYMGIGECGCRFVGEESYLGLFIGYLKRMVLHGLKWHSSASTMYVSRDEHLAKSIRIESIQMLRNILSASEKPIFLMYRVSCSLVNFALYALRAALDASDGVSQIQLLALLYDILHVFHKFEVASASERSGFVPLHRARLDDSERFSYRGISVSSLVHDRTASHPVSSFPLSLPDHRMKESTGYRVNSVLSLDNLIDESGKPVISVDSVITSMHFLHVSQSGIACALQLSLSTPTIESISSGGESDTPSIPADRRHSDIHSASSSTWTGSSVDPIVLLSAWLDHCCALLPWLSGSVAAFCAAFIPNLSDMITRLASSKGRSLVECIPQLTRLVDAVIHISSFALFEYKASDSVTVMRVSEVMGLTTPSSTGIFDDFQVVDPSDYEGSSEIPNPQVPSSSSTFSAFRAFTNFLRDAFSGDSQSVSEKMTAEEEVTEIVLSMLPVLLRAIFASWRALRAPLVTPGVAASTSSKPISFFGSDMAAGALGVLPGPGLAPSTFGSEIQTSSTQAGSSSAGASLSRGRSIRAGEYIPSANFTSQFASSSTDGSGSRIRRVEYPILDFMEVLWSTYPRDAASGLCELWPDLMIRESLAQWSAQQRHFDRSTESGRGGVFGNSSISDGDESDIESAGLPLTRQLHLRMLARNKSFLGHDTKFVFSSLPGSEIGVSVLSRSEDEWASCIVELLNCVDAARSDLVVTECLELIAECCKSRASKSKKLPRSSISRSKLARYSKIRESAIYTFMWHFIMRCGSPNLLSEAISPFISHMKDVISHASSVSFKDLIRRAPECDDKKLKKDILEISSKFGEFCVASSVRRFREDNDALLDTISSTSLQHESDSVRRWVWSASDPLLAKLENPLLLLSEFLPSFWDSLFDDKEKMNIAVANLVQQLYPVLQAGLKHIAPSSPTDGMLPPSFRLYSDDISQRDNGQSFSFSTSASSAEVFEDGTMISNGNGIFSALNELRGGRKFTDAQILSAVQIISTFVRFPWTVRSFRREIWEIFLHPNFFDNSRPALSAYRPLIHAMLSQDKTSFVDLLNKFPTSQSINVFTGKESEGMMRVRLLQRISFALFCAPTDYYLTYLTMIQERLVDCLRGSYARATVEVQKQVLFCMRVLISRITPSNLISIWPVILTEMIRVFGGVGEVQDISVLSEALRFVDFALIAVPQEFQLYNWMFLSDLHVDIASNPGSEYSFCSSVSVSNPMLERQNGPSRDMISALINRVRARAISVRIDRHFDSSTIPVSSEISHDSVPWRRKKLEDLFPDIESGNILSVESNTSQRIDAQLEMDFTVGTAEMDSVLDLNFVADSDGDWLAVDASIRNTAQESRLDSSSSSSGDLSKDRSHHSSLDDT